VNNAVEFLIDNEGKKGFDGLAVKIGIEEIDVLFPWAIVEHAFTIVVNFSTGEIMNELGGERGFSCLVSAGRNNGEVVVFAKENINIVGSDFFDELSEFTGEFFAGAFVSKEAKDKAGKLLIVSSLTDNSLNERKKQKREDKVEPHPQREDKDKKFYRERHEPLPKNIQNTSREYHEKSAHKNEYEEFCYLIT